jgi:hypothetical protein
MYAYPENRAPPRPTALFPTHRDAARRSWSCGTHTCTHRERERERERESERERERERVRDSGARGARKAPRRRGSYKDRPRGAPRTHTLTRTRATTVRALILSLSLSLARPPPRRTFRAVYAYARALRQRALVAPRPSPPEELTALGPRSLLYAPRRALGCCVSLWLAALSRHTCAPQVAPSRASLPPAPDIPAVPRISPVPPPSHDRSAVLVTPPRAAETLGFPPTAFRGG